MPKDHQKMPTILVVEDEQMIKKVLAEELKDEGYGVLTASNGQEGLDIAMKERPDLILLDIMMPVMNGIDMLQKLREDLEWGNYVPVIFLTNLSADEKGIIESIARDRPTYYLVKSDWALSDVTKKVKEHLNDMNQRKG